MFCIFRKIKYDLIKPQETQVYQLEMKQSGLWHRVISVHILALCTTSAKEGLTSLLTLEMAPLSCKCCQDSTVVITKIPIVTSAYAASYATLTTESPTHGDNVFVQRTRGADCNTSSHLHALKNKSVNAWEWCYD